MSSCGDLCTAAKCAELEARIDGLQQLLHELTVHLQDHINLPVPYSHQYLPNFDVDTALRGNELTTTVRIENITRDDVVTFPDTIIPSVTCDIFDSGDGGHVIKVGVNGVFDEDTLYIEEPPLNFAITDLGNNQYDFEITLGEQLQAQTLILTIPEPEVIEPAEINFDVDVSYLFNFLTVGVTIDGQTKSDRVYIDAEIINNFNGGGGGSNSGGEDMGCEGLADTMQLNLAEILAAIAAVQAQVTQVKEVVTVEVEGQAVTAFDCPVTDPDSGEVSEIATTEDYQLATLPAIHEMLRYLNENQVAMFERICESGGVLALPSWWQVRLGADVPQLACVFRKAGSSTYHTLSIPHPADTTKPTEVLLPAYVKGNWQGMVVCRDNSKFIINCVSKAEAERMCGIAAQLIHGDFIELPPRIYVGERKGHGVSVDPMTPTSIEYFESGQQNTIPNWRVRVSQLG
ncbi:MAG: hypothetical protein AAFQ41_03110 [Cyanobacteria bacterium J06623_7]